jgi:hypothetical protein
MRCDPHTLFSTIQYHAGAATAIVESLHLWMQVFPYALGPREPVSEVI